MIPTTVAMIGNAVFQYTKLTRLDLSKAPSLVQIVGTASFEISATLSQ